MYIPVVMKECPVKKALTLTCQTHQLVSSENKQQTREIVTKLKITSQEIVQPASPKILLLYRQVVMEIPVKSIFPYIN